MSEKYATLIYGIYDLSKKGILEWEATSDDQVFQVSFPEYSVRIYPVLDPNDYSEPYYNLSIYREGTQIEQIGYPMLGEGLTPNTHTIMRGIYENARRKALGVDQALDKLIAFLGIGVNDPPKTQNENITLS